MQYIVIGIDGTDDGALERRLAVREEHIALGQTMQDQGSFLYAAALLDETEKMVGSMIVCDFDSKADLEQWLDEEPYITGNVWEKIEVVPCKVPPNYASLKPA